MFKIKFDTGNKWFDRILNFLTSDFMMWIYLFIFVIILITIPMIIIGISSYLLGKFGTTVGIIISIVVINLIFWRIYR